MTNRWEKEQIDGCTFRCSLSETEVKAAIVAWLQHRWNGPHNPYKSDKVYFTIRLQPDGSCDVYESKCSS